MVGDGLLELSIKNRDTRDGMSSSSSSKIKRFIVETAAKSRKRPIKFDEDNDDNSDDENTTNHDKTEEEAKPDDVRGAIIVREAENVTATVCDEYDPSNILDPRLSFYIRTYLDVLLSSVLIEKINLAARNKHQSELAIPNVVDNILRYNNIAFSTVRMSTTNIALPEPLWYEIDVLNNRLQLYIYQPMYDSFCMTLSDHPVILSSGIVPLDRYDPPEHCPIANSTVDSATINCAVVCDHLAQHVISEVLGPRKAEGASIHDRYNERGCTLHSMFDITMLGTGSNPSSNNYNTFVLSQPLTIGGNGNSAFEDLLSTPFHYSKRD